MYRRFFFLLGSIFALLVLFFCWITFPLKEEKLYYIPQAGMYLKTIKRSWTDYSYVLFSKDSLCVLSDKVDYIKIKKTDMIYYMDLLEENKMIIEDRFNYISEIHSVEYEMTKVSMLSPDSIKRIDNRNRGSAYASIYPCINIGIDGHLRSVYYSNNSIDLDRLVPIN